MKKSIYLSVALIAIITFGCASLQKNYGKLKSLPDEQSKATVQNLVDQWEDYDIYSNRSGSVSSLGIMFDPKNNDTTLEGDTWIKVENKETLSEIVKWIKPDRPLNEILGPEGRFYGYLYYSRGFVTLKVVDDKKMYVFDIERRQGN